MLCCEDVLCESDPETAAHYKHRGVTWLPFRLYESVLALGFYAGDLLLRRYVNAEQLTTLVRSYAWLPVLGALALLPAVYYWGFYPPVQSSSLVLLGVATTLSIGSLSVLQAAWAPFVILAASLALYALLCRLAPGFMRLFALAPTRQADKGLAMNAESNTATHATST